MRKLIFLLFSCWILNSDTAAQITAAGEQLKAACARAGKENKNVFVMFTASWCGWCHRMKNSMNDGDVKAYFDTSFIPLYFVVDESADKKSLETPGAQAIRTQYGGDNQGIPFWLIFDKDGNLLADSMKPDGSSNEKINSGCPAEPEEVDYFISVLKKTTKLSEDQLEKIEKRFRKNKG